ncbi:TPA: hypothetical protein ACWCH5_005050, partial [Escherichia coli]
ENNSLSADQIDNFAARAKGCEARGDCKQIVKEMEDLSLKQQQEMIAVCATNPAKRNTAIYQLKECLYEKR